MGAIAIGDLVKSTLGPKGMVGHFITNEGCFDLTDSSYLNLDALNHGFGSWQEKEGSALKAKT